MMRIVIVALLALLAFPAYAVCPIVTEGGVQKVTCDQIFTGDIIFDGAVSVPGGITDPSMAKKTTGNMTLYVREAGDDANDCLTVGTACRQIQRPVNLVPRIISDGDDVLIDVGAGSFVAFNANGFTLGIGSTFAIRGTLGLATGLTGRNTGTRTGSGSIGYHTYFDDSDEADRWVPDELAGKLAWCSGQHQVIITNTATRVEVEHTTGCFGTYEIREQKTLLTGSGALGYGPVEITNIKAPTWTGFTIENLKTTGSTAVGFLLYDATGEVLYCHASGQWYNFAIGQATRAARVVDAFCGSTGIACYAFFRAGGVGGALEAPSAERVVAVNTTGAGFMLIQSVFARLEYAYAANSGNNAGLVVEGLHGAQVRYGEFRNNVIGILIDASQIDIVSAGSVLWLKDSIVDGNDTDGIAAYDGSHVFLDGVTGEGNIDVGVQLFTGATLDRDGSTLTLTGDNGDFTLNDGADVFEWSTELGSSGDIVINVENGCRAWWRAAP